MSHHSRSSRRLVKAIQTSSTDHICLSCRLSSLSRRTYASTATATVPSTSPPAPQSYLTSPTPKSAPQPQTRYVLKSGVLLSRPPLLTPDPHPFETAYHLYQRRLNERLVLPFTQYFYYKRGTPAFEHWRSHRQKRAGTATRDIGAYNAYGKEGWNDEVLVGDRVGERDRIVTGLVEEEGRDLPEGSTEGEGLLDRAGLRRRTEADEQGDLRSLERSLTRTLYLVVKRKGNGSERDRWGFPSAELVGKEGLKEAAMRILVEGFGVNMNTWFVGSHPVGHYVSDFEHMDVEEKERWQKQQQEQGSEKELVTLAGEKTFFMKARIFAGQADLGAGNGSWEDFRWLSKDEIQHLVNWNYWVRTKNMLVDQ